MQVNTSNDVKIYNLSAGKSLPGWLTDRKRRQMEKSDINIRRRIDLIQDFDMPEVSSCIKVSPNGQYILACGAYKPRVRCYDTAEMSMKFERCMDAEIVKFLVLSEDYTKMIFLHSDRFVELHAQYGKYYRIRIPKFGRDLAYQTEFCHLYVAGASNEVYRLNLEEGKFMSSLTSSLNTEINSLDINPVHQLLVTGTSSGHVQAWDPRSGKSEGVINCFLPDVSSEDGFSISKVKFKDSLNLAVGTSTGQILLYDIRSPKPYFIKDHNYGLAIKSIEFLPEQDYIASMDTKILKIWERETGKAVTSVEPGTDLNDLCVVPNSGLMFMATEAPKILSYFIPTVGPAPKWCAFLDNLTEELEESAETVIYDDYKFLTADELDALGLSDLIGTNLLRAYMHGFFVDIRLYKKAKSIVEPFNYQDYRKEKIREKLVAEQSESRVHTEKLPKVNAALARKFLNPATDDKSKKKAKLVDGNPMEDDRFKDLFRNPDFQVDTTTEEYRLLNPLVSKMDKRRQTTAAILDEEEEEESGLNNDNKDDVGVDAALSSLTIETERRRAARDSSESSEDDREWVVERRKQHRLIAEEKFQKKWQLKEEKVKEGKVKEVEVSGRYRGMNKSLPKTNSKTLERRLAEEEVRRGGMETVQLPGGNRQMTFTMGQDAPSRRFEKAREADAEHLKERKKLHRSGRPIESRLKKPWKGTK